MSKMEIAIKSHKGDTYPIRPIIAAPAALGDTIQEFFIHRIERLYEHGGMEPIQDNDSMNYRLLHNQHILKDSVTVRDELNNTYIPEGHVIYTVDFTDMYTNINIDTAIQIIHRNLTHTSRTPRPLQRTICVAAYESDDHFAPYVCYKKGYSPELTAILGNFHAK